MQGGISINKDFLCYNNDLTHIYYTTCSARCFSDKEIETQGYWKLCS